MCQTDLCTRLYNTIKVCRTSLFQRNYYPYCPLLNSTEFLSHLPECTKRDCIKTQIKVSLLKFNATKLPWKFSQIIPYAQWAWWSREITENTTLSLRTRAGLRLWGAQGHIFVGGPGPHFLGALFQFQSVLQITI